MSRAAPPVLQYHTPTRRPRLIVRLIRFGMITFSILVFMAGVFALINPLTATAEWLGGGTIGTPAAPVTYDYTTSGAHNSDEEQLHAQQVYAPEAAGYLAVFLLSQWLFLRPRGRLRLEAIGGGRLTKASAVAAGMIAMLLTIGLLATLMEIPDWWRRITLVHYQLVAAEAGHNFRQNYAIVWIVMLVIWGAWAAAFYAYGKSLDRFTALSRIMRGLVAGTILEMLVAAPVHAWVIKTRDDECYCTRGSYTGVVFGCTAIVWIFGPGVVLLLVREKKRRERASATDEPPMNSDHG
jgi:hypothetical protein